jgi:repressor LexA
VLGRVRAGVPLEAVEDKEDEVDVPDGLFRRRPDLLLRVSGDSMKDAGILDGDLIAVTLQKSADNGDVVVARIDNEITVKRLRINARTVELMAANPDYPPIRVGADADFAIEGRVLGVIRRL